MRGSARPPGVRNHPTRDHSILAPVARRREQRKVGIDMYILSEGMVRRPCPPRTRRDPRFGSGLSDNRVLWSIPGNARSAVLRAIPHAGTGMIDRLFRVLLDATT